MVIDPFVRDNFDTALTPHFISDDVVLRRIFGNQLEYYRQAADLWAGVVGA
jgi:hypothetical protein